MAMDTTVRGVVLRCFAYSDRSSIATIYTDLWGASAFTLPSPQEARRGKSWARLVQPLRVVEIVTPSRPTQGVKFINQLHLIEGYTPLFQSPKCSGTLLYISQLLYQSLREDPADDELFAFLHRVVSTFEEMTTVDELDGFDIAILLALLRIKGYWLDEIPHADRSKIADWWFDLNEVALTPFRPRQGVRFTPNLEELLTRVSRLQVWHQGGSILTSEERVDLRDFLLQYAQIHLPSFGRLDQLHSLALFLE